MTIEEAYRSGEVCPHCDWITERCQCFLSKELEDIQENIKQGTPDDLLWATKDQIEKYAAVLQTAAHDLKKYIQKREGK